MRYFRFLKSSRILRSHCPCSC